MALSPEFLDGFMHKCAEKGINALELVEQYAQAVLATIKEAEGDTEEHLERFMTSAKSKAKDIGGKIKATAEPYKKPMEEWGKKTMDTAGKVKDIFAEQIHSKSK